MTCVNQKNCALLALSVSSRKHEVLTSVSKNLCHGFNAWSRWQSSETTEQHQYQFNQLKTVQCNTNNPATIICELWYKPCYGFLCLEMQQVKNYEAYNTCCKHKWYAISLSSGGASYSAKGLNPPPSFCSSPPEFLCKVVHCYFSWTKNKIALTICHINTKMHQNRFLLGLYPKLG